MTASTSRFAAFAAATTLTLLMLAGIDGLARHPSQDARLAALAAPPTASRAATDTAPTVNASLAAPGCPSPAAAARS